MIFYLLVTETQHTYPVRFQEFRPRGIMLGLRWIAVDAAIDFYFELMFNTKSIKEIPVERMLPSKLETRETTTAQRFPKLFFCGSRRAAKFASKQNGWRKSLATGSSWHE
jgi:hypothetical protein